MYSTTTVGKDRIPPIAIDSKVISSSDIFYDEYEEDMLIPPESCDLWAHEYYCINRVKSYVLGVIFRQSLEIKAYDRGGENSQYKKIYISDSDEAIQILFRNIGGKNETKRSGSRNKFRFFSYIDEVVREFKLEEALIEFGHNFKDKQFNGRLKENKKLFSFMKDWVVEHFEVKGIVFDDNLFCRGLEGLPPDYKRVMIKEEELYSYSSYLESLKKNDVRLSNFSTSKVKDSSDLKPFIEMSRRALIHSYKTMSIYNNKDNKNFKAIPVMRGVYNKSFPYENLLFTIKESMLRVEDDGKITENRKTPNFSVVWRVASDQDFIPLYDIQDTDLGWTIPLMKQKFIYQQGQRTNKFCNDFPKKCGKILKDAEINRQNMINSGRTYDGIMEKYESFKAYLEHLYGYRYLESLGFNPNFQPNLCYILYVYKDDLDRCKTHDEKFRYIIENSIMSKEELSQILISIFEDLQEQSIGDPVRKDNLSMLKREITVVKI